MEGYEVDGSGSREDKMAVLRECGNENPVFTKCGKFFD